MAERAWTACRCRSSGFPGSPSTSRSTTSRSEEHTSELQSLRHLVCRLLLEKKNAERQELTILALVRRLLRPPQPPDTASAQPVPPQQHPAQRERVTAIEPIDVPSVARTAAH